MFKVHFVGAGPGDVELITLKDYKETAKTPTNPAAAKRISLPPIRSSRSATTIRKRSAAPSAARKETPTRFSADRDRAKRGWIMNLFYHQARLKLFELFD